MIRSDIETYSKAGLGTCNQEDLLARIGNTAPNVEHMRMMKIAAIRRWKWSFEPPPGPQLIAMAEGVVVEEGVDKDIEEAIGFLLISGWVKDPSMLVGCDFKERSCFRKLPDCEGPHPGPFMLATVKVLTSIMTKLPILCLYTPVALPVVQTSLQELNIKSPLNYGCRSAISRLTRPWGCIPPICAPRQCLRSSSHSLVPPIRSISSPGSEVG